MPVTDATSLACILNMTCNDMCLHYAQLGSSRLVMVNCYLYRPFLPLRSQQIIFFGLLSQNPDYFTFHKHQVRLLPIVFFLLVLVIFVIRKTFLL